jgi:hypothetical protein
VVEVGLILCWIDHRVVGCAWGVMEGGQAETWRGEEVLGPESCHRGRETVVGGRVLEVGVWVVTRRLEGSLLLLRVVARLRVELGRKDVLLAPLLSGLHGYLVIGTARWGV